MKHVLVAALATATLPTLTGCGASPQQSTARAYLSAWARGDVQAAAARTTDPTRAASDLARFRDTLHLQSLTVQPGHVSTSGDAATADFSARLQLRGVGGWSYTGHLALHRTSGRWLVRWTTTDLHPQYADGSNLALRTTLPPRADLLDRDGRPLFTEQPVVNIGVERARAGAHAAATERALASILDVDGDALAKAVIAAAPHAFVPVITLRRAAYEKVKPRIYSLPGAVFTSGTQLLPPTTGFARALLGTVGADGRGLGGLQGAYDARLAGRPATSVDMTDRAGATIATLTRFPGAAGRPVRTTVDPAAQRAAEGALSGLTQPAALVAVRTTDGAVLAAAGAPGSSSFDRALVGRYPPGSTFKIVTSYAALGAGVGASTRVPCPPTVTVAGRTFRNFEGETSASADFARDFALSCNTAFIDVSRRLGSTALRAAATAFGIGAAWRLGLDGFSGTVPAPTDAVDKAAEAIGQGRVLVSPLGMALAAAAVADGRSHTPVLVTDPPLPVAPPRTMDRARIGVLRSLMQLVVTSGTAARAHLPAGTRGKTGTAEFGSGNPPQTHAWFVGYRGDVAFAVVVEGGGVGGKVAAPLAATFLRRYAG